MNFDSFLQHGFELDTHEKDSFAHFLELFLSYNAHTNLSAIREESSIIEKHFVDSLYGASVIGDVIAGKIDLAQTGALSLLDIGSGGGFPGIPLKIIFPELEVTLLDSVGKKVKAMNHFIEELHLDNIIAIQERAEVLGKNRNHVGKYDFVVSRATAYITDILDWAIPFLNENGKILLYKMPNEEEYRDMEKYLRKGVLDRVGDMSYRLGDRDRIIYIFSKKQLKK